MGISGLLKYTSNDLAVQIKNLRDWGSDPQGLLVQVVTLSTVCTHKTHKTHEKAP